MQRVGYYPNNGQSKGKEHGLWVWDGAPFRRELGGIGSPSRGTDNKSC